MTDAMDTLEDVKSRSITCTAPVNIAVVKYWGKRNDDLVLPLNSSLSATLSQDELCAKTTVMISKDFSEDQMWLNGVSQSLENARLRSIIKEIRRRAAKRKMVGSNGDSEDKDVASSWKLHICSKNNFPTAAGLASSAAGYACLVYALSKVYGIEGDISSIARMGSGSACRSVFGGFVAWNMGKADDGSDSCAEQIVDVNHWPEMRIIILVVSDSQKEIGSTTGMAGSVKTSVLLAHRATTVVPERMEVLTKAVREKDFETFAVETMKDSNQFHAVCQDTYPPVFYMNEASRKIVSLIHKYNDYKKAVKVAYTFDAGPSACLYLLEKDVAEVMSVITYYFPTESGSDGSLLGENGSLNMGSGGSMMNLNRGIPIEQCDFPEEFYQEYPRQPMYGAIKYVISTKVGEGPKVLPENESLLSDKGQPKISLLA